MNSHLRRDLEKLKERVLKVAIAVEENVRRSVRALCDLSEPLAKEVVSKDLEIDKMEVDTEEECLKILALHQPVAGDLRSDALRQVVTAAADGAAAAVEISQSTLMLENPRKI